MNSYVIPNDMYSFRTIIMLGGPKILEYRLVEWLVPIIRIVSGFAAAIMLGVLGDVIARVFNLAVGFPWDFSVHQNLQVIGIGIGTGVGANLAWVIPGRRLLRVVASVLVVLAAGIVGAYIGLSFGPGLDATYWWSRYATDITVHVGGAALSLAVATAFGLIEMRRTRTRFEATARPLRR